MTSKEKFKALLDLISACGVDEEDRPKFYKLWDEIENDLERLEHYDLIKSDMDIFEKYRDDLNYICNLLNTYCKDREDWNSIVFKFQSIIGAINCCQLQQGAYDRLEVLKKNSDKVVKDSVKLINKNLELQQENEKLKKENEELKEKIERMKKIEKYNLRILCDNPDLD